jgi:glycosyltransferase involved in cell wall biosynthesis
MKQAQFVFSKLCRNFRNGDYRIDGFVKKPVVNTNIGWAQELIIHGESGFCSSTKSFYYADKIITLLKDTNLV